jgi:hypothetical protein
MRAVGAHIGMPKGCAYSVLMLAALMIGHHCPRQGIEYLFAAIARIEKRAIGSTPHWSCGSSSILRQAAAQYPVPLLP